jgi:ubiquitin
MNPMQLSAYVYEPVTFPAAHNEFGWQSEQYYQQQINPYSLFSGGWQSEQYYQQQINPYSLFSNDPWRTLSENSLLRILNGGEGMTSGNGSGTDTSGNDYLYHANDVPVGDGTLPLLLAIFGWFVVVNLRKFKFLNLEILNI